eukprot:6462516-Amphidinium_carterae.1
MDLQQEAQHLATNVQLRLQAGTICRLAEADSHIQILLEPQIIAMQQVQAAAAAKWVAQTLAGILHKSLKQTAQWKRQLSKMKHVFRPDLPEGKSVDKRLNSNQHEMR